MARRIVLTPDEARQSTKEGVVRYVMAVSTVVVVVVLAVAYAIFF